ncbi:MAG: glycosyltransferase family 2 protein [Nanoarchaeota archaeon]
MVKISIIIVNYNGLEHLDDCFKALNNQTYKDFETIMVDNGSKDSSVEFVQKNFPSVKIVKLSKNLGFTGGNNAGIKAANGEYILLLNNDTYADKDFLRNYVKEAENHKGIGMFSPLVLFYYERNKINSTGLIIFKHGVGRDRGFLEDVGTEFPSEIFGASGVSCLYKREMLEDIKLNNEYLDEDFFAYNEDLDLAFRAQLRGWKSRYVPSAKLYHKLNSTSKKIPNLRLYCGERNKILFMIKDYPFKILIKFLPFIMFRQIISLAYHLSKFRFVVIRARLDTLKLLLKFLHKRKIIQKNILVSNKEIESWFAKVNLFAVK